MKYKNKLEYVVINDTVESIEKAEKKKWALECQGYNLINSRSDMLVYKNENYLNKRGTKWKLI